MSENQWFTCAEFNARTQANYDKHRAQRYMKHRRNTRRSVEMARCAARTAYLNASLVGGCIAAVGVLVSLAVGVL